MWRLKYAQPDITIFTIVKLTEEMKSFLRKMMIPDLMVEDKQMTGVWDRMSAEDYFGEVEDMEIESAVEVEMEEAVDGDAVEIIDEQET